tara:strand:- start:440 stop:658 length:219 start_codon:yes stop_codon:yes gene_type:complete
MELVEGIRHMKFLVKRLRDAEVFSEDPVVLERLIDLFQTIELIDLPEKIDPTNMFEEQITSLLTEDGKKVKA